MLAPRLNQPRGYGPRGDQRLRAWKCILLIDSQRAGGRIGALVSVEVSNLVVEAGQRFSHRAEVLWPQFRHVLIFAQRFAAQGNRCGQSTSHGTLQHACFQVRKNKNFWNLGPDCDCATYGSLWRDKDTPGGAHGFRKGIRPFSLGRRGIRKDLADSWRRRSSQWR